jgi:hypothetical protein
LILHRYLRMNHIHHWTQLHNLQPAEFRIKCFDTMVIHLVLIFKQGTPKTLRCPPSWICLLLEWSRASGRQGRGGWWMDACEEAGTVWVT